MVRNFRIIFNATVQVVRIVMVYRRKEKHSSRLAPSDRRFVRKFRVRLVRAMNDALDDQGMTRAELAAEADWKESYVSRIMSGTENVTLRTIARFEEAAGADLLLVLDRVERDRIKTVLSEEK